MADLPKDLIGTVLMLEHLKTMDKNYCRLCLKHDFWNSPLSVFAEGFEISTKILTVHGIQIAESDTFSKVICHLCLAKLEFMDDIRRSVLNSNSILNNIAGEQVVVGDRSASELIEEDDEEEEEEEEEEEDREEEEEKTERTCNRCEFVTSCASELSVHLELHNRVSSRNCPRCEVIVLTENELVEHMKQKHKHKTLAIHYCTQCCHLIYGNSQFYQHCRTQHGGGHQNKKRKKSDNRKSRRRKERVKPVEGERGWKPVVTHRERIVLKISKTSEDGGSTRGELMQLQTNSNDSQVGNRQLSSNSQGHQLQTSSNSQVAIVNKQFSSNSQGHQLQSSQVAIVNKQSSSNSQLAIVNKQFSSNSRGHQLQTSSNSQLVTSGMKNMQPSSTDVINSQTTSTCSKPTEGNICWRTENGDTTPSKKGRLDHGEIQKQRRGLGEKPEFPQSRLSEKTTNCDASLSSADKCHPSEGFIPSRTGIPEDSYTFKKRGLSAGFVPNSIENITSSGHEKGLGIVMDNDTNTGKGVDIVKVTTVSPGKENSKDWIIEKERTAVSPGKQNSEDWRSIGKERTAVSPGKQNSEVWNIEKERTAVSPGKQNSEVWNVGATAVPLAQQNSEVWSIEKERTAVSPGKQNSEVWNITDDEMNEETLKVKDLAKAGSSILVDLNESYHDLVIDDEDDLMIIDEEDLANDLKVQKLQTAKRIPSAGHHQEPAKMPHETLGVVEDDLVIIGEREPVWLKANKLKTAGKHVSPPRHPRRMPNENLAKVELSSLKHPQRIPHETMGKVEDDKLSPLKPNSTLMNGCDHKPHPTALANKLKTARKHVSSPKHPQKMPHDNLAKVDDDKLSSPWKPNSTLMNDTVLDEWDQITAANKIYIDVDDIDNDDVMMMTDDHDDMPMATNDDDNVSEVLSSSVADGSSSSRCSCCSSLNNFDLENLIEVKDEYPSPSYD